MKEKIWLTIDEVCSLTGEIKETVRRKCKREEYISTFTKNGRFKIYSILLSSLPMEYQNRYLQLDAQNQEEIIDISNDAEEYANAPIWARKQADKYLLLINKTKNLRYKEVVKFIKEWNIENPELKTSYTRLYEAKKRYETLGVAGLLSQKGQNYSCEYKINAEYFDYYKNLYLKEGSPSVNSCWRATLGYAIQREGVNPVDFPTARTFDRHLKSEVPEQVIYYARRGESAWNKKFAMYVQRDYSKLKAGTCWVSDHAQIDIAVKFNNNICFPWVTVFRDVKTSKWLGWFLHAEAPNSDHIFQAFYYGANKFGIPDPACGSGHILVTAFSVLYEIYKSQGWQDNEIPEMILKNNLYGLDICDRAAQLAQFAVMMKAREYDRNIFSKVKELNICSIKDTNWLESYVSDEILLNCKDKEKAKKQIELLKNTFKDAKEYGSILDVEGIDFDFWNAYLNKLKADGQIKTYTPMIRGRLPYTLKQARIMQQKYECVISNPPYMGNRGMSVKLSDYVKKNYKNTKTDFFAIFIEKNYHFTKNNGYTSMITQPSWLFLSSFEELRKQILDNQNVMSVLHMGRGIFGIDFGSCAFTLRKSTIKNHKGVYFRLHQRTFQYINPEDIANLYLTAKSNHSFEFDFTSYKANQSDINVDDDSEEIIESKSLKIYNEAKQTDFHSIPGAPIAYWASDKVREIFANEKRISEYADVITGMTIGDNNLYMRFWHEVNNLKINFNENNMEAVNLNKKNWIPYLKGGGYRKWAGLNEYVVNWAQSGNFNRPKTTMKDKYLLKGITWSFLTSYAFSARFFNYGFLWDVAGSPMFLKNNKNLEYVCGFLGTKIARYFLNLMNSTLNFQAVEVAALPIIFNDNENYIKIIQEIVSENIKISTEDWDSFETSWDFEKHPLLRFNKSNKVQDSFSNWKEYKQEQFNKLKTNEEELNRLFIEIYGLQDEMTPKVADKDITVALADELREIKSLLSYAVGCMFGRYSLDEDGLVFAGGEFDKSKYKTLEADEDAVIPVLAEHMFSDDITSRFKDFLKAAFGVEHFDENLEYVAKVLGKKNNETADDTIRNYFMKDFYKDHIQTYKKRPIYWMFSSSKGNFNALVYMHRYNKDTASVILNSYLRNYRDEKLAAKIAQCKHIETSVSSSQTDKIKAVKERETMEKIVTEVTEYERDILYPLATERKEIDLDDGVRVNYLKFGKALKDFGLKAKG